VSKSSQSARKARQAEARHSRVTAAAPVRAALRQLDAEIVAREATARYARAAAWHDPGSFRGMHLTASKMVRRGAETEAEFLSRCMQRERVGESSNRLRKRIGTVIVARDAAMPERTARHDGRSGRISGRDTARYTPSGKLGTHVPNGGPDGVAKRQAQVSASGATLAD
jgi:hypothetical protein